jgi:DNA-binding MarR family transcriptional regulator
MMRTYYGHLARVLHACADQAMTAALAEMELTAAQSHILCYITHRKDAPCARDIEEAFHLSHPTVSGLLARLEKKGFIEIFPDEADRRCKRIGLQNKGQQCIAIMHRTIEENERVMVQGFTEEEQELFFSFLKRAIHNMGGDPCCRKSKEETT